MKYRDPLPGEQWRQLPAPWIRYEVSNCGRIRQYFSKRHLSPATKPEGYQLQPLRGINGERKTHYVHRLVALAWCEGDTSLTVNHKNLDKRDNRAENLEWVTFSDNHKHAHKLQPWRAEATRQRMSKPVIGKDPQTGVEMRYASLREAGIALGHWNKCANICHAIETGRLSYGFSWRYDS
jgi:hypothetical protein